MRGTSLNKSVVTLVLLLPLASMPAAWAREGRQSDHQKAGMTERLSLRALAPKPAAEGTAPELRDTSRGRSPASVSSEEKPLGKTLRLRAGRNCTQSPLLGCKSWER
jgi:hypothetical protein